MTDEPTKAELIDRIESLEEQQAEFAAEQERVLGLFEQFKQGQISRRTFLTAVAAVGGVGLVAGRSRAAPSWGSSTGKIGTSSTPLSEGYIQTLKSQSLTTERLDIASKAYLNHLEDVSTANGNTLSISSFDSITANKSNRSIIIDLLWDAKTIQQDLYLRLNGDGGSTGNYNYVDESGTESTNQNEIVLVSASSTYGGAQLSTTVSRFYDGIVSVDDAAVRANRVSLSAVRGHRGVSENITSVEIIPTSGSEGKITARVFERRI